MTTMLLRKGETEEGTDAMHNTRINFWVMVDMGDEWKETPEKISRCEMRVSLLSSSTKHETALKERREEGLHDIRRRGEEKREHSRDTQHIQRWKEEWIEKRNKRKHVIPKTTRQEVKERTSSNPFLHHMCISMMSIIPIFSMLYGMWRSEKQDEMETNAWTKIKIREKWLN